ncbi:membrane-bound lytic murein transglycosylase MltC [Candidatus Profftia sp. (ex Adelges kitamiensis)]
MKKFLVLILIIFLQVACSGNKNSYKNKKLLKDTHGFNILMGQFSHDIENIWGINEVLIAGPKDYVKYINQYLTRIHINFYSGQITVETISSKNPVSNLKEGIITTLLMGDDPNSIDLYSDLNNIKFSKEPFLYGQVLDNNKQPIRWKDRASNFANYLIHHKMIRRISRSHVIYSVIIQLVPNHMDKRARKYFSMVHYASYKYGIDESLILAIIQAESNFNPYAVSNSNALGLMQIVPHTAGKDVFLHQGKWGVPSRSYLFNPKNNINIGTAYLSILQNHYLGGIQNKMSRLYAVITAYNEGAGNVLHAFSSDRNYAVDVINNLTPVNVYKVLLRSSSLAGKDCYLYKVNNINNIYKYIK